MANKPKHFSIPEDVLKALEAAARADGRSVNQFLIVRILEPYFYDETKSTTGEILSYQ